MRRTVLISAVSALLTLPTMLSAQAVRNGAERLIDHKQIADNERMLERDQQELQHFGSLLAEFDAGLSLGDARILQMTYTQLVFAMQREVDQGREKLEQARREVRQSRSELRGDRREIREDRRRVDDEATARTRRDLARDRVNRWDDRRDLRDDWSDRTAAQARAERQAAILAEVRVASRLGEGNPETMDRHRMLFAEFYDLQGADYEATEWELREDRRELREDRRETRHDRRKQRRP